MKAVRDALLGTDTDEVRSAMTALSEAMQRIGAHVYGQPGAPPEGGEEAPARQKKGRWRASSGRCRGERGWRLEFLPQPTATIAPAAR